MGGPLPSDNNFVPLVCVASGDVTAILILKRGDILKTATAIDFSLGGHVMWKVSYRAMTLLSD
jgi:hypothetical protein